MDETDTAALSEDAADPRELARACADLLQHLGHPVRLRANALAGRRCAGAAFDADEVAAQARRAMRALDPLQQTILARCDLDGQPHARVAQSLGLSRRQFYRHRALALQALAAALLSSSPRRAEAHEIECLGDVDLALALSRSLEQAGEWRVAADRLERLAESSDAKEKRFWLELRLVETFAAAGKIAEANARVQAAIEIGAAAPGLEAIFEPAIAVARATVANAEDNDAVAASLLRRALPQLRAYRLEVQSRRASEVLLSGLLLRSELAHGEGALADALTCAGEALGLTASVPAFDSTLTMKARTMVALSHVFVWDEPRRAERELASLYNDACASGYVYEAAMIAVHLAGLYRLSGRPAAALSRLLAVLGPARSFGPSVVLGGILVELAHVYYALGSLDEAQACLEESKRAEAEGLAAVAALLEAHILLSKRRYVEALETAENAEHAFDRLGRTRLIGHAVLARGRALAAMRQRRRAAHLFRAAIDLLTTHGQPLIVASARNLLRQV